MRIDCARNQRLSLVARQVAVARRLATSSTHSPAEAAQIWGLGYLTGEIEPAPQPAGPAGMTGVVGTLLDPFLVNKGLT